MLSLYENILNFHKRTIQLEFLSLLILIIHIKIHKNMDLIILLILISCEKLAIKKVMQ